MNEDSDSFHYIQVDQGPRGEPYFIPTHFLTYFVCLFLRRILLAALWTRQ